MKTIEQAIADLKRGSKDLEGSSLNRRIGLLKECLRGVSRVTEDWVIAGCLAKKSNDTKPGVAEEYIGGPVAVLRFFATYELQRFATFNLMASHDCLEPQKRWEGNFEFRFFQRDICSTR